VAPTAYTTFYVGVLANSDALKSDVSIPSVRMAPPAYIISYQPSMRPHFEIYFTVSYGLNREQLEGANFVIKNSDPLHYNPSRKVQDRSFHCYASIFLKCI
jgi:DNA ligase 4